MWEMIQNVLTSDKIIPIFVFIIILLVIALVGVNKGWFSFHGKGVSIGKDEKERSIIRQQIEYAEVRCNALTNSLPKDLNLDYYRTKYIVERVFDELVKTISFNHINDSESYVSVKQDVIYNTILSRTEKDYFKTEEFKDMIYEWVKDVLKRLMKIRQLNK